MVDLNKCGVAKSTVPSREGWRSSHGSRNVSDSVAQGLSTDRERTAHLGKHLA